MAQSLAAIKIEGVISVIGFLGGVKGIEQPSFLECLNHLCVVRGILVGSREMFEEMNKAIDVNGIKPVVDEKVFPMEKLEDAYQYLVNLNYFGRLRWCADYGYSLIRSMWGSLRSVLNEAGRLRRPRITSARGNAKAIFSIHNF